MTAYSINVPATEPDFDTVSGTIAHLDRLRSQSDKLDAERKMLDEAIVEARQRISRAIKVLHEALQDDPPQEGP